MKSEVSLGVGLAVAALVWGTYQYGLPSMADIRAVDAGDPNIAAAERAAAWQSAAVVAGVSLIAQDATVFILGGSMIIGLSLWARHSNYISPHFGSATMPSSRLVMDQAQTAGAGYTPA